MAQPVSESEKTRNWRAGRRIWIATAWYLGIIYASQWVLWFLKDASALLRGAVGLTPMIGIALMLRAIVETHRESDELQRRIDGEAAVISACAVGLGCFAIGLAQAAIGATSQPTVWAMFVGPSLMAVWALAKWRLKQRYG